MQNRQLEWARRESRQTRGRRLRRRTDVAFFNHCLAATSKGEMLSAMTAVKGSAGYVALERVTGVLDGRSGSFVLQHYGIMTRGRPQLTVTVVPDSGTGQLEGLSGAFTIDIEDGKHFYELQYELPEDR